MRTEREQHGILIPQHLFVNIEKSGVPSAIASGLTEHEVAHAGADKEGKGVFGFRITSGWIIAYYMIIGERSPEQMMAIASAPGFSEMSEQDWRIYTNAWGEWLREKRLEKFEKNEENSQNENGIPQFIDKDALEVKDVLSGIHSKGELLEILAKKLDEYQLLGKIPSVEELLETKFTDLFNEFGETIIYAYEEACDRFRQKLQSGVSQGKENVPF